VICKIAAENASDESPSFSPHRADKVIYGRSQHLYEVRPRKDHRGVDLVSDALPFGQL
jgi:hypothetical protein